MSDLAIRVESLGKRYTITPPEERPNTLRDVIARGARGAVEAIPNLFRGSNEKNGPRNTVWALRDVSFEVARGEVVGIIGANGAGKSTILKILSRITEPTTGEVEIRGRVGSLLEVGTGFHSELTGRENIYLNGAILGMGRREIEQKFDEMVAFAEVERFIDTPVKHYSSGMYLRLAFAVAAHLEPEILIVDEVLAVGDAEFQRKCLGKMKNVASEGRTVVFVTHDMDALRRLCTRCALLKGGRLVDIGSTQEIISRYLASGAANAPGAWINLAHADRSGTQEASFEAVRYTADEEVLAFQPYPNCSLAISMKIHSNALMHVHSLAATFYAPMGAVLVNADIFSLAQTVTLHPGQNVVRIEIESLHLLPGIYTLGLWLGGRTNTAIDHIENAAQVEVVDASGHSGAPPASRGIVPCRFTVEAEHRRGK